MNRTVIFILSLVATGCAKEAARQGDVVGQPSVVLTADDIRFLEQLDRPTLLSESETAGVIDQVVELLGTSTVATRYSDAPRAVASIRPLVTSTSAGGAATRGDDTRQGETLLSVVDFEDERGYCIIAADRRLPLQVMCFVGDGSFPDPAAETSAAASGGSEAATDGIGAPSNPGLGFMLGAMENYAHSSVERHSAWCDSVETSLLARLGRDSIEGFTRSMTRATSVDSSVVMTPLRPGWRFHRQVTPLVPVEWDQRSPFNATVVANTEFHSPPVGCVALAAAGIMAYWGHPTVYHDLGEGGRIDWSELTRWSGYRWNRPARYRTWDGPMTAAPEATRKLVADLLWHVACDVDMDFGASVSLAYTSKAALLLNELGFSSSTGVHFSDEAVRRSLDAARPLLISGASHKLATGTYYANSHAWIVDGYIAQRWYDCFSVDGHLYECEQFRTFVHSNFGWSGLDNGYYAFGVFNTNAGPDLPSDTRIDHLPDTRAEWIGQSYNYQYNLVVYPDIYK